MSIARSFRDLNAYDEENYRSYGSGAEVRPLWAQLQDRSYGGPTERNDALLKWINCVLGPLLQWREGITQVQKLNVKLFKGQHYMSQEDWQRLPQSRGRRYSKNYAKIVCNYLLDATETHVSDLSAYEPNLTVSPANNEEIDKVMARTNKEILDYYFYENDLKTNFQAYHRRKKVMGETFKFVLWNPDAGELHPAYKQLRQMRRDQGQEPDAPFPVVGEDGQHITGEDGGELWVNRPVYIGDLQLEDEFAWNVYYPPTASGLWADVPWLVRIKFMPVDEVKARWPKMAEKLHRDSMFQSYRIPRPKSLHPCVMVRFLYAPPQMFLEDGYYCASTETAILETGKYPFNHTNLPCIRGTDIDIPGEIHGMSFYQNLVSLQYAINNATSMILQNQSLYAYPKYQVPRGAKVNYRELDDDRGIYEYSGAKGPELISVNSTPQDVWRWRDAMRDEFKMHSAIFATSEGRGVDGITANVALRLIEEQERKLHKPAIDKHGSNIEMLGSLMLSTLGTYRQPDDGALIKVLGKNNERYLKYFDASSLSKPYEVRLKKSSGLPQSPAAKTQTVIDIATTWPDLFTSDEVLEYMDIQRPEKLVEIGTISRQSAESEVEDILQGVMNVKPPAVYHDLIPRYRVYEKAVQSRAFDEADPAVQQRMINHILTCEYLMATKAELNPMYGQLIAQQFPNFPMFFPLNAPRSLEMLQAPPPVAGDLSGPQVGPPPGSENAPVSQGAPEIPNSPPPEPQTAPPPGELP